MALNEQMQQMVQQDIQDAETRPKAEILQEQMEGLKTAGRTARDIAVESIPGVSEALAEKRVDEALKAGDKVGAGIEATAGLLGIVPGVGDALAQGVRKTKAPLRKLLDKLPQKEIDDLPSQPDDVRIYGYHGTARERKPDEPFFDINFARKNDQFLGEGFYFTLDPKVAEEYSNLRAFRDFDVEPLQKGKDPVLTHRKTGKQTTVGNLQKGLDIDGNPLTMGQSVSRFDLSNIEKPYVVRTEKQRKDLKAKIPELKKQGYDAVLFADFKDRSKQIMVFPEHMDKIDTSAIAGRSATSTVKDAEPLQIGINPATKDGALLKKYDASIVNRITENSSAATAGTKEANKLINAKVADGEKVGIRLNLNSTIPNMPKGLDKLQTLHKNNYNGKALSYKSFATVEDVTFNVSQKGRQGIAARIKNIDVPEAKSKFPAMSVDGKYNSTRNVLDELDDDVVEIGFNPANGHLFVDMSTGQAVKSADVATVIGDRVYAKGVTYMKKAEAPDPIPASDGTSLPSEVRYKMKKGGVVPMNNMARQMELFEPVERGFDEGGLMEEGGMVDEESGNEVPPGSLREEVRDDIPAQLSEGEFVFPADVVRYIGLENLMRMRQEAKQGLAQMEAMGQMGNSEEATVEDDLPFDMYDLDVDEEEEYNSETRNYQVGGYVAPTVPTNPYSQPGQVNPQTGTYTLPGTGIAGYQVPTGGQTGYTPYGGAAPYFQPVQFTGPQYQTALQTTNLPTFAETVGQKAGQYDELRTYQNDAGQTMQIPFKDGKPIYPIPEGYRPIGDQPEEEEAPTTVTPTLGQAQVRDDGDDFGGKDHDLGRTGATTAFGGTLENGRVVGGYVGDLSFENMSMSDIKTFGLGIPGSLIGQLQGKPNTNTIPDDAFARVTNLSKTRPDGVYSGPAPVEVAATVRMKGKTYNDLLTNTKVTQRQRMASAIDFIKEKYGDDAMNPDKIIDLDIELADMDMREDVRDAIDRSDLSDAIKDSLSKNNDIGNVSVNSEGKMSINNPFEAARIAKEEMKSYVSPSRGDSDKGDAPSGRETSTSKDLASGVGVRSEDRDAAQASRDKSNDSGGGGRSGEGLDSTGRADI